MCACIIVFITLTFYYLITQPRQPMKKFTFLLAIVCTVYFLTSCGPTIYKSENFESSRRTIKTVAILPFFVSIDSKHLPKNMTIETLRGSEQKSGYDMQNDAYTWLLQRSNQYSVTFQDVDKTNALLTKANITYDSVLLWDKGDLCKLLGVDATISGKASLSKPMSEGGAIALTVLVGAYGTTNKTTATLSIHNVKSDLLWKYDFTESGSIGSNSQSLTKALMKNASKNFPYKAN